MQVTSFLKDEWESDSFNQERDGSKRKGVEAESQSTYGGPSTALSME